MRPCTHQLIPHVADPSVEPVRPHSLDDLQNLGLLVGIVALGICEPEGLQLLDEAFPRSLPILQSLHHHRLQGLLHRAEGEEGAQLPYAPQAAGVGVPAEYQDLVAGHHIDRQHFEAIADVPLVDAHLQREME